MKLSLFLVFGLITLTLVNCHSVNRRDTSSTTTVKPENSEEESAIGKFFDDFTTNIKKGAQKTSDAFQSGFNYVKNKIVPSDDAINNSTTTELASPAVVVKEIDVRSKEVSTATPSEIGNRNLFEAPAMCKENEQVGRSGDCRPAV